jgi:hypothetical protein
MGRCGNTSCSLPMAIKLPLKVRKPSSVSIISATSMYFG